MHMGKFQTMSRRLKPVQAELVFDAEPPQPREVVCHGDEFLSLCGRAQAGELAIEAVAVGRTPADWVCAVRWPQKGPA